ncbi:MAG: hypothetical protein JXR97_05845 [Planctomycetes bacterium]|nr:hypothetical protein [Planctomycetota bacterium]
MIKVHGLSSKALRGYFPSLPTLAFILACIATLTPAYIHGSDKKNMEEERLQLARNFSAYDFEPREDSPVESRDMDGGGWPDYWEAVIDDNHRAEIVNKARIVRDDFDNSLLNPRPGLYYGEIGHVLQVPFDGTPVALRTRIPKVVDPDLAYNITAFARMKGLDNSITRIWLVWLHIDEAQGERELDRDEIIIQRGQRDWPESPFSKRINDLPVKNGLRTNGLRIVCEIVDDPNIPGADRHGMAWFDDIRIESKPKLRINPVIKQFDPFGHIPLKIEYLGLIENIPDPDKPGSFKGKSYSRTIEVTDLFGREPRDSSGDVLPELANNRTMNLNPGPSRSVEETINLKLRQLGIHYVTVKMFGYDGSIQASVSQAIGFTPPPSGKRVNGGVDTDSTGTYGILLGAPPQALLEKKGTLTSLVQRAGVFQAKVDIWPKGYKPQDGASYTANLTRELRNIRGSGVHITGTIPNTAEGMRMAPMQQVMKERTDVLEADFAGTVYQIGPHVEFWQWGQDSDNSFTGHIDTEGLAKARSLLSNMTSVMISSYPVNLSSQRPQLPPDAIAQAASLYIPAEMTAGQMLDKLVKVAPDKFRNLKSDDIYPPESLSKLIPTGIKDSEAPDTGNSGITRVMPWVSLELKAVPRHERSAIFERAQLEDMTTKAVIAKAIGMDKVFLGELVSHNGGLIRIEEDGKPADRPALLAANVLEQYLGGAKYLGSFQLQGYGKRFPNFIFGDPRTKSAIIALWYEGAGESEKLNKLEIASLPLTVIDMAGNKTLIKNQSTINVYKAPILITGLSIPLALTRMSVDISDNPPLLAQSSLQRQDVVIKNYFDEQLPAELRIRYAANSLFMTENNWTVRPEVLEDINLPSRTPDTIPSGTVSFSVQPDSNSVLGKTPGSMSITPDALESDKFVRLTLDINTAERVRMRLLRKVRLRSDLEVNVPPPLRQDNADPNTLIQMWIKWIPSQDQAGQSSITIAPYYVRQGQLPTWLPKRSIPASTGNDTGAPSRVIKFLIPRPRRPVETWIGLEEDGGDRFYKINVTDYIAPLGEQ